MTIVRKGGRGAGKEVLRFLGAWWSRAGLVHLGYKFEYSISLNIFLLLISRIVRCSAHSGFKTVSSYSFLKFYWSVISSNILLRYWSLFKLTTPHFFCGYIVTVSLLYFNFCRTKLEELEITHLNGIYICISWYSKICWFSVKNADVRRTQWVCHSIHIVFGTSLGQL